MASVKKIAQQYYTNKEISQWTGSKKTISSQLNSNQNYQITYISIQGLPGIKFWLNGNMVNDALYLNGLGYFELDLAGTGAYIHSIEFDVSTAKARALNNPKGYILVDYILSSLDDIKEEATK